MKQLVRYLTGQHFLVNLITILVFVGGILAWNMTSKEELPDVTFNFVRVSTSYSGASAEDVEFYVTKPIEEALQGIDGVRRITSTSSPGSSSVSVELERSVKDIDKKVTEIQSQVSTVSLPKDVLNDPRVRVFETSKKAIIDVAIYHSEKPLLSIKDRIDLQNYARGLETNLLSKPEIFEVRRNGYLKEELNINANPEKFTKYEISLNSIAQEIERNHIRAPSGTLKSGQFEQVTVLSELDEKEKLDNLVVQGGFDSKAVKLSAVATITDSFEDQRSIFKVNGREAILLNIVKNSHYGILDSLEVVKSVVSQYQSHNLKDTSIKLVFLDDESIDVRNRLSIISLNGLLGFCLISLMLFVFLNKRSGFWVALGIPFTLCFTLISGYLMGFTINGITLAGIIIVLGIVVDDAIIVTENITRRFNEGESLSEASVKGAQEVISPILASVLTTCAAFIPLYFFSGRFGDFVKFIPPIIFIMLFASVLESFFLLPAHMAMFSKKRNGSSAKIWFKKWENTYESILTLLLPKRYWIMLGFIVLMIFTGCLTKSQFKFVMFPDEESREIVLSGIVDGSQSATETATKIQVIEDYLVQYVGKEGVAVRTEVARGRRGDASQENQFRITLEILPKEKREKSSNQLVKEIETAVEKVPGISNLKFRKRRFGQSSGSVFEIVVAENDDIKRQALVETVIAALKKHSNITNVEPDIVPLQKEYLVDFNQDELKRLSVNPSTIATTLRTVLNGKRLYSLLRNDEEVDVNITVSEVYRRHLKNVLKVPVENNRNYLIPLGELLSIKDIQAKKSIRRQDLKRTSFIYADLIPKSTQSPLELADELEHNVFPLLLSGFPSSELYFDGEVVDTRESKRDLTLGIITAISLIYLVLAILFNSVFKPLRIMLIIPFGVIGVILAFYLHQKLSFGFYAAIGTLGMLGVVVNDAIVMLNKLDKTENTQGVSNLLFTSGIAKTRLRAILLTTFTTVAGVMPTAYGIGGTDTMLSDMMIALAWGLLFGTMITLILTPCIYLIEKDIRRILPRLRFKGVSLFIGILVLGFVISKPTMANEKVVSLDAFITQAAQNDAFFHALLIDRLRYQYDQDINVSAQELAFSVASEFSINTESEPDTQSLSLSQTLPRLGQTMTLSYTDSKISKSSFTFSQDIARNAFGASVKLDSRIQSIKTDIAKHQLIEAYEDYLAELISLYYTWIRQYESLELARAAYRENEKVLISILSRQKKKIANDTDVNKLKLQTWAKKEQVISFERDYAETSFRIKQSLGADPAESLMPSTVINLDRLPESLDVSIHDIQNKSRTFMMLEKLEKQTSLERIRIERDLLPSAKLSGGIAKNSETYGLVGLSIHFPLQNSNTKAKVKVAEIDNQQITLENITTSERLKTVIRSLHSALIYQHELIEIASKKRQLAYSILNSESENYSYGKISLNDYIVAVNRYDGARFDEIDRKITYQKLSLEWKRLTDRLVVKSVGDL